MIGVGLVGYGAQFSMGKHHSNAVSQTEGLELRGVFDIAEERRAAAKEEQPTAHVYDGYEEFLADKDIELVVLVTPHHTHAPLSIAASKAGKHVMTEKVMCLNLAEADAMIAAAKEADRMLTVYQNRRWDGDFLAVREIAASGALGEIFQIESSVNGWWFPEGWRGVKSCGGGMLYDWGAHLADQLVQLMLPAKPKTVFAVSHAGGHDVDIETQTTALILFDNGVSAEIDVGCSSRICRPRWLIRGTQGALEMRDFKSGMLKTDSREEPVEAKPDDWPAAYRHVSAHLLNGEELAVKPEEVRIGIAIIEAAFESAASGRAEPVRAEL